MFSRYPITRATHASARRVTVRVSSACAPRNDGRFGDVAEAQQSAMRLITNAEGRDPGLNDITGVAVYVEQRRAFYATRGANGRFTVREYVDPATLTA